MVSPNYITNCKRGNKFNFPSENDNHLGNVLAVIVDAWYIDTCIEEVGIRYAAHITQATDYSAFGAPLPGRSWYSKQYRYGLSGKEKDDEIKGANNSVAFADRTYDPRIGRWLSVDRLFQLYPFSSPYCFALNTPIQAIDPDGQKVIYVNGYYNKGALEDYAGGESKEKYWGYFFVIEMNKYLKNGKDEKHDFVDGAGSWNSTGEERFQAGYEYAKKEFASLTEGIFDANGVQKETIKIVSHSMGAAYSEGMIKYLEEQHIVVEKVIHLSPADPSGFTASTKPQTIQLNLENDAVLNYKNFGENNKIKGVDTYGEVKTPGDFWEDSQNNHWATKYDTKVISYLQDLESISFKPTNKFSHNWFSGHLLFPDVKKVYRAEGNNKANTQFNTVEKAGATFNRIGQNDYVKP